MRPGLFRRWSVDGLRPHAEHGDEEGQEGDDLAWRRGCGAGTPRPQPGCPAHNRLPSGMWSPGWSEAAIQHNGIVLFHVPLDMLAFMWYTY